MLSPQTLSRLPDPLVDLVNENRDLAKENKYLREMIYALEKEKPRETRRSGWGEIGIKKGEFEWGR